MRRTLTVALACASAALPTLTLTHAANYADSVVAYVPGTGPAIDQGYTNSAAALGEPSRSTPGAFGGPVDPFNPPYLKDQLVGLGAGGSLTVAFSNPISNDPRNRFGMDFIIYGNAGFAITNGNFSGGGITDGSLFGANSGTTRVSVSADNITYYTLDPARAPVVDTLFPTDGSGSFELSVDPALTAGQFSGLRLDGIRSLYGGSGGGAGFDIAWAQDATGQPVSLPDVRFIRVDVLSDIAEIDGFSATVPEPGTWVLLAVGSGLLLFWRSRSGARLGSGPRFLPRRSSCATRL
jgi:hypothetical protein